MKDRKGVDLEGRGDGEELGGIEVGETVIRNIVQEKNLLSIEEIK